MDGATPRRHSRARPWVLAVALLFALTSVIAAPTTALAGIVGTDEVVSGQRAELDRERLVSELEREEVRTQLERYGVDPSEARERVAAMTDAELGQLVGGLDEQPAGAGGAVTILLVIIVLLLILR